MLILLRMKRGVSTDVHMVTGKVGTPNGKVFRLRGKGVPNLRGGFAGDLNARIVIEVPCNLDRKQRELLEEFQRSAKGGNFPAMDSLVQKTKVFFSHRDKLRK